jgi:hypothetical protein
MMIMYYDMTPESRNNGGIARRPLLGSGSFSQQRIRLKSNAFHIETSVPRLRIQKRFRSHSNEPPEHSTVKNARILLLKEVISIRFEQNLPQGEN